MKQPAGKTGVLTSGGDAPGMNAAIRAITLTALLSGLEVAGIHHGYRGLLDGEITPLGAADVCDILYEGGSMLCSGRCDEFRTKEGVLAGVEACRRAGIDSLIVIGGDGSFRGARELSLRGIPCIGIPGTIDNDIACSEYTIGFDTAIGTVVEMAERLRHTSRSHDRCYLMEVMGRGAGDLALHAGIACGATAILLPEVPWSLEGIAAHMRRAAQAGRRHYLVVVSEAVTATKHSALPSIQVMAERVEELTGIESRAVAFGYVQRGGSPSPRDRITASQMGKYAVDLLLRGEGNRVVAVRDSRIVHLDIDEALHMRKPFYTSLYELAEQIAI